MKTYEALGRAVAIAAIGIGLGKGLSILTGCVSRDPIGIVYPPKQEVNPAAASALVVIVQDEASGRWKWQATAKNNQPVAESEQDFATADAARDNYVLTRQILEAHPAPTISNLKL